MKDKPQSKQLSEDERRAFIRRIRKIVRDNLIKEGIEVIR